MGLPTILFLIFLVLKLTGFITWPWIGVFAPLLIELVLDILIFVIFGSVARATWKRIKSRSPESRI